SAAMQLDHFQHRCDVVFGGWLRHAAGTRIAIAWERPYRSRQSRALFVGFAGHDGGYRAAERPAFHTVVTIPVTHDQRAEIRVTKSKRSENVRVFGDIFDGITRVIDNDFLRGDEYAHRRFESLDIKIAVRGLELHQIERGEIARRVIEEKVLRARIS